MNITLILAFLIAIIGFIFTFFGLRYIHLRETNKPIILLSSGLSLLVFGTLFFFIESIYSNVHISSPTVQQMQQHVMPTKPIISTQSATGSATNQYSSQFVQQFMQTCQATIGKQQPNICQCILGKIEQFYTPEQIKNIKSPSDLSPVVSAQIATCLQK
jgi:hypothetical protein